MKVGIMSMQRVINNGSFLQSYSLMKNIEKLGHKVLFVDYEVGEALIKNQAAEKTQKGAGLIKRIQDNLIAPKKKKWKVLEKELNQYYKMEEEYKNKMFPLLGMTGEVVYRPMLDVLVLGSDEVFNCLQPNEAVGYSKQLFGAENRAKKVLSYAASFGNTTKEGLEQFGIDKEIAGLLKEMSAVSVRDKNSVSIVKKIAQIEPFYHVDPVFLYDYEEEMPKEVPLKNYIVVYAYGNRISKKEAREIIKFAKKKGKKIITLCGVQDYLGEFVPATPFQVLAYVKHADYVITDTFHGSVFSIKFNKSFATLVRQGTGMKYGNSNKLEDLLERFGLHNRILSNIKELASLLETPIAYEAVNEKIREERNQSIAFLEEQLH